MRKDSRNKAVADYWDSNCSIEISKGYWTCHPIINEYVNAIIAPGAANILEWFKKRYAATEPLERGLSLGCGTGAAERQAIETGLCRYMDGVDISPASIETARREAEKANLKENLHYMVMDLNSLDLPARYYDFALYVGSLHHIDNLEYMFDGLKKWLKPNAYIFINEYVGPSRLQWTEKQLSIINKVWEIVPTEYKKAGPIQAVDREELIRTDPSEAARSTEIIPLLYRHFEVVEHIDYGGGFLVPFWSQVINPDVFLNSPDIDKQIIIKLLCFLDQLILEEKILPSCYAQIVAKNNTVSLAEKALRVLKTGGIGAFLRSSLRYIKKSISHFLI
jgi:SAM-dependent methyltransferase